MTRFVVLLHFTEQGIAGIQKSTERAAAFSKQVEATGGAVELLTWTLGSVDGVVAFTAPDEETAVALILSLAKQLMVRTTMLRAFNLDEFSKIATKVE